MRRSYLSNQLKGPPQFIILNLKRWSRAMMRVKMRHWSESEGFRSKSHWYLNGINLRRHFFSITLHRRRQFSFSLPTRPNLFGFLNSPWHRKLLSRGDDQGHRTFQQFQAFGNDWLEFNTVTWKEAIVVCKLETIQEICKLLNRKLNSVVFWEPFDHNSLLLAQKWLLDLSFCFVFLVDLFNRRK